MRSAYETLIELDQSAFDAIPGAVYVCAADGLIVRFNRSAAKLWGRSPSLGNTEDRFCAAARLCQTDGRPLPPDRSPVAVALESGRPVRDEKIVMSRHDGARIVAEITV
jgi:PAS domain-containing protein